MTHRPPIRVVTRLLAELQSSILSRGLALTNGDLIGFTILSLIVRQTRSFRSTVERQAIPVLSLAASLTKPYETVRRRVGMLAAAGLCERSSHGVSWTKDPIAAHALENVLVHSHDALVRFIDDLGRLGVGMPRARPAERYDPSVGMMASVDIMLSVLDGNRRSHAEWMQLVLFSEVLAINAHRFARDPAISRLYPDETCAVPLGLISPASTSQVQRLLGLPDTSVRRHLATMAKDGRLIRIGRGWVVSEDWLNRPECVEVSRASFSSMRRILERMAAAGFPFTDPTSAYLERRPLDVMELADRGQPDGHG